MAKTYFENREISCIERIDGIVKQLPYFVEDFFVGVESRTSPLTRLNYAYDLRIFFDFMANKVMRGAKKMSDVSFEDLKKMDVSDFEYFLSYYLFHCVIGLPLCYLP